MKTSDMDPKVRAIMHNCTDVVTRSQLKRDMNALRGLYNTRPEPKDMQTILLHAGEDIQPAVRQMVRDGELMSYVVDDREYFAVASGMKAYKPTL